jgi:hypothetical protein
MLGDDALSLIGRVVRILDRLEIPYLIGGSIASTLFGEPRGTRDVDLVIELGPARIEPLARALEGTFYVSREAMKEAVADRRSFNAIELDSGMKADLFVRGDSEFDRSEFSRRRLEAIVPGELTRLWIKSPEDSILRKLLWHRDGLGASSQQWRDVLGILATRGDRLDDAYLNLWAAKLDLVDSLAKAREEAKP